MTDERHRTERLRVNRALLAARQGLAEAERRHAAAPTPDSEAQVAQARRDLETLERRALQVNS